MKRENNVGLPKPNQ